MQKVKERKEGKGSMKWIPGKDKNQEIKNNKVDEWETHTKHVRKRAMEKKEGKREGKKINGVCKGNSRQVRE